MLFRVAKNSQTTLFKHTPIKNICHQKKEALLNFRRGIIDFFGRECMFCLI